MDFYRKRHTFAKLNLFLDINNRRDDGYHDILTVFRQINLCDTLLLRSRKAPGINIRCNVPITGNLIEKVYGLLRDEHQFNMGLDVILRKRIPIGAGLGGGSGNAAGFLLYVNDRYGLELGAETLTRICGKIGSDAAFFIKGGCQVGRGKGEILVPAEPGPRMYFVVVSPGFPISTAESYQRLDPERFGQGKKKFDSVMEGLKNKDIKLISDGLYNIFEAPADECFPVLKDIRTQLREAGALNAMMSGSGSCVFGLFSTLSQARKGFVLLKRRFADTFLVKSN